MSDTSITMIPVGSIRVSEVKLRGVDKKNPQFVSICQSIEQRVRDGLRSLIMPITVREEPDPETGAPVYVINDGLQRFTACVETGQAEVPAIIETAELSDEQFLVQQLMANFSRVQQRPADAGNHLQRLMAHNPAMSVGDLAEMVAQDPAWIKARLSLTKLNEDIQELVNDNEINVTNATNLAKVNAEHQEQFVDSAKSKNVEDFAAEVNGFLKEQRKAAREAREATGPVFTARLKLRSKKAITDEFENPAAGTALLSTRDFPEGAAQGWALAIAWVLNGTEEDVAEQRAAWDKEQAEKAEKKALKEAAKAETEGAATAAAAS